MSDFTDREMLRQLKEINKNMKRIASSLAYLEHCFKPIRGKYTFQEGGSSDVSKEAAED